VSSALATDFFNSIDPDRTKNDPIELIQAKRVPLS
jgi:hypothetical protein